MKLTKFIYLKLFCQYKSTLKLFNENLKYLDQKTVQQKAAMTRLYFSLKEYKIILDKLKKQSKHTKK